MSDATLLTEAVGWTATAVFTTSFLFSDMVRLRAVQICGAMLWMGYGVLIGSPPVIVANVLVFVVACWTTLRYNARRKGLAAGTG